MSKFETDKVVGNKNGNDINVDSIEEDIKILENYLKESAYKKADNDFFKSGGWEIVDLTIPLSIEHLLSDYTRQKQINEQQQKINGELREKVKQLKDKYILEKVAKEEVEELLEDSIPRQKIIDKVEEIEKEYELLLEHQSGKESNRTKYIRGKLHMGQELLQESEEK